METLESLVTVVLLVDQAMPIREDREILEILEIKVKQDLQLILVVILSLVVLLVMQDQEIQEIQEIPAVQGRQVLVDQADQVVDLEPPVTTVEVMMITSGQVWMQAMEVLAVLLLVVVDQGRGGPPDNPLAVRMME